jgi:hypothetical protein
VAQEEEEEEEEEEEGEPIFEGLQIGDAIQLYSKSAKSWLGGEVIEETAEERERWIKGGHQGNRVRISYHKPDGKYADTFTC